MKSSLQSLKQAEMFALLAMVFLLMIGYFTTKGSVQEDELSKKLDETSRQLDKKSQELEKTSKQLEKTSRELEALKKFQIKSKAPPIISNPSKDLSFETARAFPKQGSNYLRNYIKNIIVPRIEKQLKNYVVDMIEIVGHTDGNPINGAGNLDQNLLNDLAINKNKNNFNDLVKEFKKLKAGSNADLGLIRALIVVKTLQDLQKTGECKCKVKAFRAYSAAQLYLPGNKPNPASSSKEDNPNRRRIEIRFTKWNPN